MLFTQRFMLKVNEFWYLFPQKSKHRHFDQSWNSISFLIRFAFLSFFGFSFDFWLQIFADHSLTLFLQLIADIISKFHSLLKLRTPNLSSRILQIKITSMIRQHFLNLLQSPFIFLKSRAPFLMVKCLVCQKMDDGEECHSESNDYQYELTAEIDKFV